LNVPVNEVFATVGEAGIREVVAAFYQQVPADSILGPMYPADDLEGAEHRLRSFLVYRFGGPDTYLSERDSADEAFIDTFRRVGMTPFKTALYGESDKKQKAA